MDLYVLLSTSLQRNGQEAAVIMNEREIGLVARLLSVELDGVSLALTHRVTVRTLNISSSDKDIFYKEMNKRKFDYYPLYF